ncbi:MAG: alpha/beta fold hydrolase [Propionibacteriales bacterium]|nr:alpha/beta fold hydrolase [Propionibacteriales bacterium]
MAVHHVIGGRPGRPAGARRRPHWRDGAAEAHPLTRRWRLLIRDRPALGGSADVARVDVEYEARVLQALVSGPAHLVGHSYGGVVARTMASAAPHRLRSLTVSEPPAFLLPSADIVGRPVPDVSNGLLNSPTASRRESIHRHSRS